MKLAALCILVSLALAPLAHAQSGRDAIVDMLVRQDYDALESVLSATQRSFEDGTSTEYALRKAFEPFATLRNPQALAKLRQWVEASPRSYVANLAVGLNYRTTGSAARGTRYWDETSPARREELVDNFSLAEPFLRKSLALALRPYLSALNLMIIAGNVGRRPFLNAALLLADEALPANALAKTGYARYLLPRWGGSYARFDAFVALSREQGVADGTLLKLQAMELNDRGAVLLADHDSAGADALFRQALQRVDRVDDEGGFRAVYLAAAVKHVCRDAPDAAVCHPAGPAAPNSATVAASLRIRQTGEDIERSIVIPTEDESEGVRTEYAWLALRYPGARRTSQALIPRGDRHYDLLTVTTADGQGLNLYFDITAFYGKSLAADRANLQSAGGS